MVKYTNKYNTVYTIIPCIIDDVEKHHSIMQKYFQPDEYITQKERMLEAIETGSAFKMLCKGIEVSFFYFERTEGNMVGVAYYQTNGIHLVLFTHFVVEFYKNTRNLIIKPHKHIPTFIPIVEDMSIRKFHYQNSPLYVYCESNKVKNMLKIYEHYRFTYEKD